MKYATAVAAFVAGASAAYYPAYPAPPSNGTVWVTTTVDSYTTVCPSATSFSHGGVTYTATASETITVTNCPCTVSFPVTTATTSACVTCSSVPAPLPPSATPAAPVVPSPPSTPNFPVPVNGTIPVKPSAPSAAPTKSSPVTSPIATFTGAANKAFAASGASLAAVFGLVVYAL